MKKDQSLACGFTGKLKMDGGIDVSGSSHGFNHQNTNTLLKHGNRKTMILVLCVSAYALNI